MSLERNLIFYTHTLVWYSMGCVLIWTHTHRHTLDIFLAVAVAVCLRHGARGVPPEESPGARAALGDQGFGESQGETATPQGKSWAQAQGTHNSPRADIMLVQYLRKFNMISNRQNAWVDFFVQKISASNVIQVYADLCTLHKVHKDI